MMNLSYRGVNYTVTTVAVDSTESEVLAHYRGATYRMKRPVHAPTQSRHQGLVYRGAIVR